MANVTAKLSNYRQSPRKTRLVADLVKGKSVAEAITLLDFTVKKAAHPLKKLISSAVANAKHAGLSEGELVVKDIRVDQAATLYRHRPAPRGSAHPIRKRSSHVTLVLSTEAKPRARRRVKKSEPATQS